MTSYVRGWDKEFKVFRVVNDLKDFKFLLPLRVR